MYLHPSISSLKAVFTDKLYNTDTLKLKQTQNVEHIKSH